MSENIWWVSGDRFLATTKKEYVIAGLNKNKSWTVKDISDIEDSNDLAKIVCPTDLFDINPTVYIYEGKTLPDADLCFSIIENSDEDKAFIIITKTVDNRTKFTKLFKKYLTEFLPVRDSLGFINDKLLEIGMQRCKKLSNWKGSEDVFNAIMENSEHDYGCIINEIEKLRIYSLKSDEDISIEDFNKIGCIRESQYTDLLNSIKERDLLKSMNIITEMEEEGVDRNAWIPALYLILESFDLFMFCKFFDPLVNKNEYTVGVYITKLWTKKGLNVHSGAIGFRYIKDKKYIIKRTNESILNSIAAINKAILNLIYKKDLNHINIIKDLIFKII